MKILLYAVLVIIGFVAGSLCHTPVTTSRINVLVRRDTVRVCTPAPISEKSLTEQPARLERVEIHDTVEVMVPVVQRVYAGPDYRAYVSGYRPSLDSLVFTSTAISVTESQALSRASPTRRWSIGLQAGYGLTPAGPQPYIGLGLTFKLL